MNAIVSKPGSLKPGTQTAELKFTNTEGHIEVWQLRLNEGSPLMENLAAAGMIQQAWIEEKRFKSELAALINKHSLEQLSNTPDFILARCLYRSLENLSTAIEERDNWYGISPKPGQRAL